MTSFEYFANKVPEGTFLCALCFEGKPVEQAWTDVDGQRWDECLACAAATRAMLEKELLRLRATVPASITPGDVRAAEQAWNGLTIREAGRWWDVHEDAKAAFIADHLNRARDRAPDPGPGRDETTEGNG